MFGECAPMSSDRIVRICGEGSKIVQALKDILHTCNEVGEKNNFLRFFFKFFLPDSGVLDADYWSDQAVRREKL